MWLYLLCQECSGPAIFLIHPFFSLYFLTLILLTWTIWRAPTNTSKWRMAYNSAFKGLNNIDMSLNAIQMLLKGFKYVYRWRIAVCHKLSGRKQSKTLLKQILYVFPKLRQPEQDRLTCNQYIICHWNNWFVISLIVAIASSLKEKKYLISNDYNSINNENNDNRLHNIRIALHYSTVLSKLNIVQVMYYLRNES